MTIIELNKVTSYKKVFVEQVIEEESQTVQIENNQPAQDTNQRDKIDYNSESLKLNILTQEYDKIKHELNDLNSKLLQLKQIRLQKLNDKKEKMFTLKQIVVEEKN